jgi:arylsulfatase A-like enzyme
MNTNLMRLLTTGLLAAVSFVAAPAAETRPNVLFILMDDFGWRDFSCYGASLAETPVVDRLARESTRFDQAYVAYPRCVPSRYAFWTGKHPAPVQGTRDSLRIQPGRDVTLGTLFQQGGYRTFFCGKWHLGEQQSGPAANGFAVSVAAGAAGATRSHFAPFNVASRAQDDGGEGGEAKAAIPDLDDSPAGEYLADRQTTETIKFIRAHRDQPFFAVLSFYAVHTPIQGKEAYTERYRRKLAAHPPSGPVWEQEGAGENLRVQNNAVYASMVQSVDENIGRLLAELDALQLAANTIVVIASDHGGLSARGRNREMATSNRPLRAGKGHLYEGGLRIPLIIRWPGRVPAGRVEVRPVSSLDLLPTLVEMTGVPATLPAGLDGVSFAPFFRGDVASRADRPLFWHNPAPRPGSTGDNFSSAVRLGNWKLLHFPEADRVELYDLASDLGEAHDLAAARPAERDRLLALLNDWRSRVGAGDRRKQRERRD